MIKDEFPNVKLIESSDNLGFGKANNLAISQTNARYCFLLNTDTVLINNAVKILYDYMEKPENNDVGACGGQLYNNDLTLQHSVGEFDTLDKLYKKALGINFSFIIDRYKNIFKQKIVKHKATQNDSPYVFLSAYEPDFIIGADLMLRKSALNKAGVFDERFLCLEKKPNFVSESKKMGIRIVLFLNRVLSILVGLQRQNQISRLKLKKWF